MKVDTQILTTARLKAAYIQARTRAVACGRPVLTVVSFDTPPLQPLDLFVALDSDTLPCTLWESRAPGLSLFGWGCERELRPLAGQPLSKLNQEWAALVGEAIFDGPARPLLLGGQHFDPLSPHCDPEWAEFPRQASLMLHQIMYVRDARRSILLCQQLVDPRSDPSALARRAADRILALLDSPPAACDNTLPVDEQPAEDDANAAQWCNRVAQAVEAIRAGELSKVVLARAVRQAYTQTLSPARILHRLRRADDSAHLFAVRRGNKCFIGATPERLVRVENGHVHTHALAGTSRRDPNPDIDRQIGEALLSSRKERHEHELVVRAIRDALQSHCTFLDIADTPQLRRLQTVQHLSTPIHATLHNGLTVLDLVAALHPTPAVAGYPRDAALAYLRQHEPLDRGWYAAPLGWMDSNGNGDFIVALRCALIEDRNCCLYAGCGIVGSSNPEQEYEETRLKLSGMRRAIAMARMSAKLCT